MKDAGLILAALALAGAGGLFFWWDQSQRLREAERLETLRLEVARMEQSLAELRTEMPEPAPLPELPPAPGVYAPPEEQLEIMRQRLETLRRNQAALRERLKELREITQLESPAPNRSAAGGGAQNQ